MSGIISFGIAEVGANYYVTLHDQADKLWNGSAMEVFNASNWTTYGLAVLEQAGTSYYSVAVPADLPAGIYLAMLYRKADVSFAIATDAPASGTKEFEWDGTNIVTVQSRMASSDIAIKKNTALANFEFVMTDSTGHAPMSGATISGTRSIDGASFASLANAVSEVGSGVYKVDLAATDLNGDVITLRFAATGADDRLITIVTQAA